jgi:PKD repeat protein
MTYVSGLASLVRASFSRSSRRSASIPSRLRVEELEPRRLLSGFHYDFGTRNSPVAPGYIGVAMTAYSASLHYGWSNGAASVKAFDRSTSDPLTTDFNCAKDQTFMVDLPNGSYDVQLTMGDASQEHDNLYIYLQGQLVASNLTTLVNQFIQPAYRLEVSTGQLDVRLTSNASGSKPTFALDGLDVNASAAPTASAGPGSTGKEGSAVAFTGTKTSSTFAAYAWNFGDGSTASGTLTPSHTYLNEGTYTVTLSVTDSLGYTAQGTTTATVVEVPPTPNPNGPYSTSFGLPIAFSATATDPNPVDMAAGFSFAWDFGDGNQAAGAVVHHTYTTTGTYTVKVTATAQDGYSGSATTSATVNATGAFAQTDGVYSLGNLGQTIPSAVLTDASVTGVALRAAWNAIETGDGVYDWSYLDSQVGAAASAGKRVSISVLPGIYAPAWLYADGAQSFGFVDTTSPSTQTIPIPWDPIYLAKWQQFIHDLGVRYGGNSSVSHVKTTGINAETPELVLPQSTGVSASNGTTTWTTTNDVADWQAAGYTRVKILAAWQTIGDAWSQAFPQKQMALEIVGKGLPPLDDNGNVMAGTTGDGQGVAAIIKNAIASYGAQFIAQNDGLSDWWISQQVSSLSNQVTIGFQMLSRVTNDPSYWMNNGTPIDIGTELQKAIDSGVQAGARYLEIYAIDVTNTSLTTQIANAQAELAGNAIPVATMTHLPATGQSPEGTPITLGSMLSEPESGTVAGTVYSWSVTKNGVSFATGSGSIFTFTPDDEATYVVSLTATDAQGRSSPVNTQTIVVYNVPPIVNIGGPYAGTAGTAITFAATATDPSLVDVAAGFTFQWNWGDGTTGSGATLNHTFVNAGVYTVTLTVKDQDGVSTVVTTTVTVS